VVAVPRSTTTTHHGSAALLPRRERVHETIGAELARIVDEHRHSEVEIAAHHERFVPQLRAHERLERAREARHHGAHHGAPDARRPAFNRPREVRDRHGELVGGGVAAGRDPERRDRVLLVEQPQDDVRVAGVDREQHHRPRSVTSPA
jgi:hypothetical protein